MVAINRLFCLALFSILLIGLASATWWDNDWSYKKAIQINTTLTSSNVSVLINVTWNSNMRTDFGDLRFISSNENNELGYWFYNNNYTTGDKVQVWVFNGNLSASANKTIYMYYGNPTASTTSNIKRAFMVADDFTGTTLNSTWIGSTADFVVGGGVLNRTAGGGFSYIQYDGNYYNDTITEARISATDTSGTVSTMIDWAKASGVMAREYTFGLHSGGFIAEIDGSATGGTATNYVWYRGFYSNPLTGNADAYLTGDNSFADLLRRTASPTNRNLYLMLEGYTAGGMWDWIYVRRYMSVEPTYTFGSETANAQLIVTQNYPTANLKTYASPVTFNATITPTDLTIVNATIKVWDQSTLVYNDTQTYVDVNTTKEQLWSYSPTSYQNYTWLVSAYGSNGVKYSGTNKTFSRLSIFENSQTFNLIATETSQQNFTLNLSYDPSFYLGISAQLNYNNTIYSSTKTTVGDNTLFTSSVTTPTIVNSTVIPFYWTVTLTNSSGNTYFNSTNKSQTIIKSFPIYINTSCPAGTLPSMNFTFGSEIDGTSLTANVSYLFNYGLNNNLAFTINSSALNINNLNLCINATSDYYYVGYGEIDYSVGTYTDRKFYVFTNTRITNQTISNTLYSLPASLATSFQLTVQKPDLTPYENYYVSLLRWYPSENTYKVVEMGKTDEKGQTVFRVKTEDVDYKFGVYRQDGTLVKLTNPVRMVCASSPCEYSIYIEESPLDLTSLIGIQQSLTFNNNTKQFLYTWNDPSQKTQVMNLTVYKDTGIGSGIVCSQIGTGFTGTLVCDVSTQSGMLRAEVTRTASPNTIINQLIVNLNAVFGSAGEGKTWGLLIGVSMVILLAFMGIFSPVLAIILAIVGLIPALILGGITWSIFIGFAVLGGIIIHFMRRVA